MKWKWDKAEHLDGHTYTRLHSRYQWICSPGTADLQVCSMCAFLNTARYRIPLWLADKPGDSDAARRKHTLARGRERWRTCPSLVFPELWRKPMVVVSCSTLPHLRQLLLDYGHQGCPLPLSNASGKIQTSLWWLPHLRCPHTRVVCVWGGLCPDARSMSVFSFSRLRCVRRDVRQLNASCPTISLIRPPLLLLPRRLPSQAHTQHTTLCTSHSCRDVTSSGISRLKAIASVFSLVLYTFFFALWSPSLQPSLLTHSVPWWSSLSLSLSLFLSLSLSLCIPHVSQPIMSLA